MSTASNICTSSLARCQPFVDSCGSLPEASIFSACLMSIKEVDFSFVGWQELKMERNPEKSNRLRKYFKLIIRCF
jgi:hypothetical protein